MTLKSNYMTQKVWSDTLVTQRCSKNFMFHIENPNDTAKEKRMFSIFHSGHFNDSFRSNIHVPDISETLDILVNFPFIINWYVNRSPPTDIVSI